MMDRHFGFGRLELLAATPVALPDPAVATALAEELFCLQRATTGWRAAKGPCRAKTAPVYEAAA